MVGAVFTLKSNVEEIAKQFAPKGRFNRVFALNVGKVVADSVEDAATAIRNTRFRPFTGSSGNTLQIRSGDLKDSVQSRVSGKGFSTRGTVFSEKDYSTIQEFGGVIRGHPLLSIPLPWTLDSSGSEVSPRFQTFRRGDGWATAGGTPTWIKETNGKLYVYGEING